MVVTEEGNATSNSVLHLSFNCLKSVPTVQFVNAVSVEEETLVYLRSGRTGALICRATEHSITTVGLCHR